VGEGNAPSAFLFGKSAGVLTARLPSPLKVNPRPRRIPS
jgi:hypothetical protein